MTSLADLVQPLDASYFLREFFEKQQMLHVPGNRGKFHRLLDWDGLNRALAVASMVRPECVVVRKTGLTASKDFYLKPRGNHPYSQVVLDAGAISAFIRDGATLIVNSAEDLHEPLSRLVATLEKSLMRRVWANVYAVWHEVPGGLCHYDPHDVLVLQVYGRKRWKLFAPTTTNPISEPPPETKVPESGGCDVEVVEGDALFVPRGWWHLPVPAGEPTVHVTLGIERRTGLNLVRWLSKELEVLDVLRASVPLFASQADEAEYIAAFRNTILKVCDDPELLKSFWVAEAPGRPIFRFPEAVEGSLAAFKATIRAPLGEFVPTEPNGEWADLVWCSQVFRYHVGVLPVLQFLSASSPIPVSSVYSRFDEEFKPNEIDQLLHDLRDKELVTLAPVGA